MFSVNFGIEAEMTGLTRAKAARVTAQYLNGSIRQIHDYYDTYEVTAPDGRIWKFMSDSSIITQKEKGGSEINDKSYSVEMVSPILNYNNDIATLQEIIRSLRKAGGFTNFSTGCHIHLNNVGHTPQSIRNFINIIASKNTLFYKALEIEPERARFCRALDSRLVEMMNRQKPKTMDEIKEIWYTGYNENRSSRYHSSRYKFLNLHSFFTKNHTIELRGYNAGTKEGILHAGLIRSYIVLSLALNKQALTQKCASSKKNQTENEKFAMRTYLNRLGLTGKEFKAVRDHLTASLDGDSAWRHGRPSDEANEGKE